MIVFIIGSFSTRKRIIDMQRYDFLLKFSNLTEQNETVLIALIKKKVFLFGIVFIFFVILQ